MAGSGIQKTLLAILFIVIACAVQVDASNSSADATTATTTTGNASSGNASSDMGGTATTTTNNGFVSGAIPTGASVPLMMMLAAAPVLMAVIRK